MKIKISNSLDSIPKSNTIFEACSPVPVHLNRLPIFEQRSRLAEFMKTSSVLQQSSRVAELFKTSSVLQESSRAAEFFKTSSILQQSSRAAELLKTFDALQQNSRVAELFKTSSVLQQSSRAAELLKTFDALQQSSHIAELLNASMSFQEINNDFSDLSVGADGTISCGNYSITSEQLISTFHEVIEPLEKNFDEAIERIISKIDSLKEPLSKKIITTLIIPLLVSLLFAVINPIADYYIKDTIDANTKRSIPKEIRKITSFSYDHTVNISRLKIVIATKLHVRNKNSVKSEIVGVLRIGAVVGVIEKKRNWCLISWVDKESGTSLQGWVFSRYLTSMR